VIAPHEGPPAVLTRVVLHDPVPLLLYDLRLLGRRLQVKVPVPGGCLLLRLPGELGLVEERAAALARLALLLPGLAAHVAELGAASAGCGDGNGVVKIMCGNPGGDYLGEVGLQM
jgi:hypothetical protein